METESMPQIGDVVQYRLTDKDAKRINGKRTDRDRAHDLDRFADGYQVHDGNKVAAGDIVALAVTRVFPNPPGINGQALLDGSDSYWVGSVAEGDTPGTWARIGRRTPSPPPGSQPPGSKEGDPRG